MKILKRSAICVLIVSSFALSACIYSDRGYDHGSDHHRDSRDHHDDSGHSSDSGERHDDDGR